MFVRPNQIFWFLLLATPAFASVSVSVSPSPCNPEINLGGSQGVACEITLTGSGSYTVAWSTNVAPEMRWCLFNDSAWAGDHSAKPTCTQINNGLGGTVSGTPVKLRLFVEPYSTANPTTGCTAGAAKWTCSRDVSVAGTSIPVTVTVHARWHKPINTYPTTTAAALVTSGCSATDSFYGGVVDTCPQLATTYPLVGGYDLPAQGGRFRDPRFQTSGCVLANGYLAYSTQWYSSANGNYFIISDVGGSAAAGVYSTATCAKLWDMPTGSMGNCQFYPNMRLLNLYGWPEATMGCYSTGATFHRIACATTCTDQATVWTAPHGEENLFPGGTEHPSSDGWRLVQGCAFNAQCDKGGGYDARVYGRYIYIVNMFTGAYNSIDLADARITSVLPPAIGASTMLDKDQAGWRIVETTAGILGTQTDWAIYMRIKDDGTWEYLGPTPYIGGEDKYIVAGDCTTYVSLGCMGFSHRTAAQANGVPFFVRSEKAINSIDYTPGQFSHNPTNGPNDTLQEMGGSMSFFPPLWDHVTCSAAPYPVCVGSTENFQSPNSYSMLITGITAGLNPTFTLDSTEDSGAIPSLVGLATGTNKVYVACEGDLPGTQELRGFYNVSAFTVLSTGHETVTVSGFTYSGSYSGRCAMALVDAPNDQSRYRVYAIRFNALGHPMQVASIAIQRGREYRTGLVAGSTEYFGQDHCNVSQNATFVACGTNNGEPNRIRTLLWEMPWQMRAINPYELAPGYAVRWKPTGSGAMAVSAPSPTIADITCTVSTTYDLATSPSTVTLSGPRLDNRTATFSGSAGTAYYWQCADPSTQFAAEGVFTPI